MSDTRLIIQGPTTYLSDLNKTYSDFILSTTDNIMESENVVSVRCDDSRIGNIKKQSSTTLAGLQKSLDQKYRFSLKIRSDFIFNDISKMIDILEKIYDGRIIFYAWHNSGYMVDYFCFGETKQLIDFWTLDTTAGGFAEQILLNNFNKKNKSHIISFEDSTVFFKYCINDLTENNINFKFLKYNITNEHYEFHKNTYKG